MAALADELALVARLDAGTAAVRPSTSIELGRRRDRQADGRRRDMLDLDAARRGSPARRAAASSTQSTAAASMSAIMMGVAEHGRAAAADVRRRVLLADERA